ncbi:MAG: DUF305 domain-containing protein [Candidatus Peribacteraceae bacterium]
MNMLSPMTMMPWSHHILAMTIATLFIVGISLLILWAARTMKNKQLLQTSIVLLVISALLCMAGWNMMGGMGSGGGMMMKNKGMESMKMMDQGMDDAMSMSMHDMSAMLEGKTGDAFDQAFIEGMIPHHQGAIDMARAALTDAKHQEIKDMARAIIRAQQTEIDQMNGWLKAWGYTE